MEDTAMTAERRRLLDKHLNTWTQNLQLDDVMLFLLANSVFNEHIVDIIKVTMTHYMLCLNSEKNSGNFPWNIEILFIFVILLLIVGWAHRDYATIPVHTTAKDARKYSFLSILSITIKDESKVRKNPSYALTGVWYISGAANFLENFETIVSTQKSLSSILVCYIQYCNCCGKKEWCGTKI